MTLSAKDLQAKLATESEQHLDAIRQMERERDRLLAAKHSGDAEAVARSKAIRDELEDRSASLKELHELGLRLHPRMLREEADKRREQRAAAAADLSQLLDGLTVGAGQVDAAMELLAVHRPGWTR